MEVSEVKQKINKRVEAELAKQLENIPRKVEQVVETAILSIIGLERTGQGYRVDRFGNKNPLNNYVERKVQEALEKHVSEIIQTELDRLIKRSKILKRDIADNIARHVDYTFEREFRTKLDKKFEDLAQKYADKIGEELDEALQGVGEINEDLFDPKSYEGKIGELLLEEQARVLAESQ